MNCGNFFFDGRCFPPKVYSLSGCVNLRQRETPAPGNPEAALMSPVYLIHGNICRARLSLHINIVFWARVSAGTLPLECHKYLLFKQLCSCILFFGAEEEQRSVFGVLDMLSYLLHQWQLHIKPVPARLPTPTLLAPQLWVTAAASAVHTKTSVVLHFFDYTDN